MRLLAVQTTQRPTPVRVLQSFPHKIGAGRICTTAWHQAAGAAAAGAEVTVYAGVLHRALPDTVTVHTTLARGRWRIPYSAIGMTRALVLHDRIVARALPALRDEIDVVHAWPLAALETLRAARRLGIPSVLERPNAHTRFGYEAVAAEAARIGVELPPDDSHAMNPLRLEREEAEYALADHLLCPSDFVAQTFAERGFPPERLLHHQYGYDPSRFRSGPRSPGQPFTALFAGSCAVRKGLHHALKAWLASSASRGGRLLIAGEFLPAYRDRLAPLLDAPSVTVLGPRSDLPELMRTSDVLLLPSLEEGAPLVCYEAIASGCVPLVSSVCAGACRHEVNALIHDVGDARALASHLSSLSGDRERLERLRAAGLKAASTLTWEAAGKCLVAAYEHAVESKHESALAATRAY